jgi:hypothetical protein
MGEGQGGGEPLLGDNLLGLAKSLRKNQTDAENLLWRHLRAKQLEGVKFCRQAPLGKYIVDFVSFEKKSSEKLTAATMLCRRKKTWRGKNGSGLKVLRYSDFGTMKFSKNSTA